MSDRLQVADLFNNLKTDATALVQDNIALAKAEIAPAAKHAGIGGGLFGGAGYFAANGISLLFLAGAFAFSLMWQAIFNWGILLALIVGFCTMALLGFIIAGILALLGKKQIEQVQPPKATIEEAKNTMAAIGDALKQGQAAVQADVLDRQGLKQVRRALR